MTSDLPEVDMTSPTTIVVRPNGPYLVQGQIEIRDSEGSLLTPPVNNKAPGTVKLCACGRSVSRPFCDGSHNRP
jgi:CDGSH-type Zn-finger protein